ncbi:MAG TPA: cytochrome c oxidase assembly protein, partial [Terriglobales bacterium]
MKMNCFASKLRSYSVASSVVLCATAAWAHPEEEAVTPQNLWRAWTWEPVVLALMIVTAMLYFRGVARLWRRAEPERTFARWQVLSFVAAFIVLVIALISPVHALGEELFSVHMAQHELLMIIAAPLVVLARPLVPMLMALPLRARQSVANLTRGVRFRAAWRALTNPVTAWTLHGLALWAWHLPYLYEATLDSEAMHALQHTFFLGTALLFWWTLLHGRYGRLGYGAAVL